MISHFILIVISSQCTPSLLAYMFIASASTISLLFPSPYLNPSSSYVASPQQLTFSHHYLTSSNYTLFWVAQLFEILSFTSLNLNLTIHHPHHQPHLTSHLNLTFTAPLLTLLSKHRCLLCQPHPKPYPLLTSHELTLSGFISRHHILASPHPYLHCDFTFPH